MKALASVLCALASALAAQRAEALPEALEGVGVEEQLGAVLPLELAFVDERGEPRRLEEFFDGERPVLLTLNYASCPMLCQLQLDGTVHALAALDLDLGADYRVLTVSIDPAEGPEQVLPVRDAYLQRYGRPTEPEAWHYLTGEERAIERLAASVGFGYAFVAETGEYAHGAVAMLCTPEGELSRYVYGVQPDPGLLRLSFVEAARGELGSAFDRFLLFCFDYHADERRYAWAAGRLMRWGASFTVAAVLGGFVWLRVSPWRPRA